jgi:hypothetical protein
LFRLGWLVYHGPETLGAYEAGDAAAVDWGHRLVFEGRRARGVARWGIVRRSETIAPQGPRAAEPGPAGTAERVGTGADGAISAPTAGPAGGPGRLLDRYGAWVALALCAGLVALVYGQALTFAFTFDDPLDLPRAEGRSVWSMLSSSEGYAYYRPIPFIIWKGLRALQGHYSRATLHGLTLAAHALGAWFLYLLLRRLTGEHWGLGASVLFITYPFSYQAVFGAHTLFHPLMTAAILLSLVLYYDARLRGDRRRLAGSVAAAMVALWTHESGVVLLPLVVALEGFVTVRLRARRPAWWPLLHATATAAFLATWVTVPKWPRQETWSSASLLPNARYFLQGAIYPVSAQLKAAGERWGFDPVRALWPAIGATLLVVLALYVAGRRPWVPVAALGIAVVVLAPAWALLNWTYVEDAPRLLYPAAAAIAALWGLLPSLRWPWRPLTRAWRVASCALLFGVALQSVAFVGVRRHMWREGTVLVEGIADAAAARGDRPLLFLNVPAWFAPKRPEYPVGHVGMTALPGYVGLGRSVYIHRGVQPPLESRGYYPDLNGWKYDFNTHGGPATIEEFAALARRVDAVYEVAMTPGGARVRLAGELRPGGAGPAPAGPRFGPGIVLTHESLALADGAVSGDFEWGVAAPPPGDYLPVLRVRDAAGRVVAETRGYPLAGIAAPRLWQRGDRVRDLPTLRLPGDLPPGAYSAWLSWEEKTTHQPLPGALADGAALPAEGLALGDFTLP